MVFQIRFLVRRLNNLVMTDNMWKRVTRFDPVNIYKYHLALKDLTIKDENIKNYINFQSQYFKSCPTDLFKKLISESFSIVKEKNLVNDVEVCNSMLRNYVKNNINFDVNNLLQEIYDNKIEFNNETFSLLIEYYCNIGDMNNVEILVKKMNLPNEEVKEKTKIEIIKGYIIAGYPEKSKNYMIENNLTENDPEITTALLLGYSSVGKFDLVMEIIGKMKQDNTDFPAYKYFDFYLRLVQSNVSDSNLEKILLEIPNPSKEDISDIILDLNRLELFDYSLRILEKYKDTLEQQISGSELMRSYNTKNCPKEIYKRALIILLQFRCENVCNYLFTYMDYNDSIIFANNVINDNNCKHIATSLVNKSLDGKSIDKIENSLQFAMDKLDLKSFNMVLILQLIPFMLENCLVTNCLELINLFPNYKPDIFRASFIYCLIKKDFDQLSTLRSAYKKKNLLFIVKQHVLAEEFLYNYQSMEDFKTLSVEVGSVFEPLFVNYLLSHIVVRKIIQSSKEENIYGVREAIQMAKNWNLSFSKLQLNKLTEKANQHKKIFQCLHHRITKKEKINYL